MTEGSQLRGALIREDVALIIQQTLGIEDICFGRTVTPKTKRFARVVMPSVDYAGPESTAILTHQRYEIFIAVTLPIADAEGMTIPDAAESKANALIAGLMASAVFGTSRAFGPKILSVQFDDELESDEKIFEFGVVMEVSAHAPFIRREDTQSLGSAAISSGDGDVGIGGDGG